jgi:hypothetical protein
VAVNQVDRLAGHLREVMWDIGMADLQLALVLLIVIACVVVATTPAPQRASRSLPVRRGAANRHERQTFSRGSRNAWNRLDLARGISASDLDSGEPLWPPQAADGSPERQA